MKVCRVRAGAARHVVQIRICRKPILPKEGSNPERRIAT